MKRYLYLFVLIFSLCMLTAESEAKEIHDAAKKGDMKRVKALLADGESVNVKDYFDFTPLRWAGIYGHFELVNMLIEHGAEVDNSTVVLLQQADKGYGNAVSEDRPKSYGCTEIIIYRLFRMMST